jgi:hypothetical protein
MVRATDPHGRVLGFQDLVSKIFTAIGDGVELY